MTVTENIENVYEKLNEAYELLTDVYEDHYDNILDLPSGKNYIKKIKQLFTDIDNLVEMFSDIKDSLDYEDEIKSNKKEIEKLFSTIDEFINDLLEDVKDDWMNYEFEDEDIAENIEWHVGRSRRKINTAIKSYENGIKNEV